MEASKLQAEQMLKKIVNIQKKWRITEVLTQILDSVTQDEINKSIEVLKALTVWQKKRVKDRLEIFRNEGTLSLNQHILARKYCKELILEEEHIRNAAVMTRVLNPSSKSVLDEDFKLVKSVLNDEQKKAFITDLGLLRIKGSLTLKQVLIVKKYCKELSPKKEDKHYGRI